MREVMWFKKCRKNILTGNTEQSCETDAGLTNEETIVTTLEAKDNLIR